MSLDALQIYLSNNCSLDDIDEPSDEELEQARLDYEREDWENSPEGIAAREVDEAEQMEEFKREGLVMRITSTETDWFNLTTEQLESVVRILDEATPTSTVVEERE